MHTIVIARTLLQWRSRYAKGLRRLVATPTTTRPYNIASTTVQLVILQVCTEWPLADGFSCNLRILNQLDDAIGCSKLLSVMSRDRHTGFLAVVPKSLFPIGKAVVHCTTLQELLC
jgi:hypothetical protein